LADRKGNEVDAKSFHGEFYELRDDILKWCGEGNFTFFFVDHTGYKKAIEIPTLCPLLKRHNSEFLITFMLDFLRRFHRQSDSEELIKEILGEVLYTSGMTSEQKEAYFLITYRERLKSAQLITGRKPRSAYAKILYPLKDRTIYDMVWYILHGIH